MAHAGREDASTGRRHAPVIVAVLMLAGACTEPVTPTTLRPTKDATSVVVATAKATPPSASPAMASSSDTDYAAPKPTVAEAALDDAFPPGPDGTAARAVLMRAVDGDIRAQASCAAQNDRACVDALAAYRRARVDYAGGRAVASPPPLVLPPFAGGRFVREGDGYTGTATLVPLADNEALLVIDLSFRGRASCSLAGRTVAVGDGSLEVTPLAAGLEKLTLTPTAGGGFTLTPTDPATAPTQSALCTTGTSITGPYAPRP